MVADILSDLVIKRVCSAIRMYSPEGKRGKRENRQQCAIMHKYEGETVYFANGKRFLSDPDHVIFLPKGSSYDWVCMRTGYVMALEFECEAEYAEPISFHVRGADKISKMIRELEYKRNLKSPTVELESVRDAYSVLLELVRLCNEEYLPIEKQQKLAPAIEYISKNYSEDIKNDELAAMTGVSTVYFRKLFTAAMGISPIAYARRLRIDKAKELLHGDYGTLTDVASFLGYSSIYDFSRDFKKHTGVAPSKY